MMGLVLGQSLMIISTTDILFCSLTSPNYKGADAAVYTVPRPHRTGMSIFQELTPYPRGYEYFPGSGQATNWLMYGCLGSTGFSLSRIPPLCGIANDFGINPVPLLQPYINLYIMQKYLSFIMYYGSALLLFTCKLHCLQTF